MADLAEVPQRMLAVDPPEAARLHSAPGCLGGSVRVQRVVVHHRTRRELVGEALRPGPILREHVRREPVTRVVGQPDRVLLGAEGHDREHRPERLLPHDGHVGRRVGQHGGLHETRAFGRHLDPATGEDLRSALPGFLEVPPHDLHLHLRGHRADVDVVAVGLALAQLFRQRHHFFSERLRHVLLHVDALDGRAGLPGVGERAPGDLLRGGVEVGVVENDRGVLAAELEHAGDHLLRGGDVHLAPGGDRPGEHDHLDAGADQLSPDVAPALHHAEEPARQTGLLEKRSGLLQDDGGELARLHHHPVARHQRGERIADRDRERIVPR